jgi:FMN-dependent NADH-azoreductase
MSVVDQAWLRANFTAEDARSDADRHALALSDTLIAELKSADTVVITCPIYNFGLSSALKAWVDQVCRAGITFRYTEAGPVGLLEGKRAILVVTSGGVPVNSAVDFATPHLTQVLRFIGISDVQVVAADQQLTTTDAIHRAEAQIQTLVA